MEVMGRRGKRTRGGEVEDEEGGDDEVHVEHARRMPSSLRWL